MRTRHWLLCTTILACWIASSAAAEEAVRWQTLDTAKRMAGLTHRLVLVHFWSESCQPCRMMEQKVFSRPEVAAAIDASFVPVKLNTDHFPYTAQQYGVSVLPTDVIITPQGQLVQKLQGSADWAQYIARLNQVVAGLRQPPPQNYSQGPPPAASATGSPSESHAYRPSDTQRPDLVEYGDNRYGPDQHVDQNSRSGSLRAEASPVAPRYGSETAGDIANQPPIDNFRTSEPSYGSPAYQPQRYGMDVASEPSPTQSNTYVPPRPDQSETASALQGQTSLPPGNPPLGLDGYCPVELTENERWTPGDVRWGVRHQGRTYLFAGPDQQSRFFADPDHYAPALSGNDVVAAVDQGQTLPGRREYGAWFDDRVYLFASEGSLQVFAANPTRYVDAIDSAPPDAPHQAAIPGPPNYQTYGRPVSYRF